MVSRRLRVRRARGDLLFDWCVAAAGVAIFLSVAYPLYFIVIASFSSPAAVAGGSVWLWPRDITFEGYKRVFEDARIWTGYRNTAFYTAAGTLISLLFTLPAAYALSRKDLKGRGFFNFFFIFTMFFSGGLIPTYLTVGMFKLTDTVWPIILTFSVSVFNLIIARTFFASTVPQELLEAAQLDGCSNTRFFAGIVLPLSKAIIAVIALYSAVGQWNQFFLSLIYVRDEKLIPLQLVLRNILIQNQALENSTSVSSMNELQRIADAMKYGVIIISSLPIMCVYPFIQKHFNKGVMIGSLKG